MSLRRREFLAGSAAAAAAALGVTPGHLALAAAPMRRRVRMGVNYVPSRAWWYSWGDWHLDSIRRDLADIAALHADHIRIQLIWPEFQPNAALVSEEKLDRLEHMLDAAGEVGLDVEVTVLDGQLSGFLFIPSWLIDNQTGKVHNFITDRALIESQQRLFDALGKRIGRHRRFLGFDIANEIYWATIPLGLSVSPREGDAWMKTLLETCDRVAPGKMHVNGVDKYPFEDDEEHVFSRRALARVGFATVTHPWEGFGGVPGGLYRQFGPLSNHAVHFSEFLIQFVQAFADEPHRPVWIEEFGCSREWVKETLIPEWAERSMRNSASCDNLFGLTWWCSHDPSRRLRGMNTLEYDLGLYTNDRKLKPIGKRFKQLAEEFDRNPPSATPRTAALVVPDGVGANRILDRYIRLIGSGVRAKIVLESRSKDQAYLRSRGVEKLISLEKAM